jgi:ribosomal protein S18 acetylase RimI-like enzyme
MPGTLFGYDEITIALDGDQLLGVEVGFEGPGFQARRKAMAPMFPKMIESGELQGDDLARIGRRVYLCSYLNPNIPKNVYYIHAIAVKKQYRGKKIGAKLLGNAIDKAKAEGYRGLHLDVLSDNPAIEFYQSMGLTCLVETVAPIPHQNGVPKELRMAINF